MRGTCVRVALLALALSMIAPGCTRYGTPNAQGWYALEYDANTAANLFQYIARVASQEGLTVHAVSADKITLRTRDGGWLNYTVMRGDIRFNTRPPGDPTRHVALSESRRKALADLGYEVAKRAYGAMYPPRARGD